MNKQNIKNKKNLKLPQEKALQLNLDNSIYGTVVEIGAGQEVARQFFHCRVLRLALLQKPCLLMI